MNGEDWRQWREWLRRNWLIGLAFALAAIHVIAIVGSAIWAVW